MIKAFIVTIALLGALPAFAAELPAFRAEPFEPLAPKKPVQLAAAEAFLSRGLEVSTQESFLEDEADGPLSEEFELKLPEAALPDSDIPLTFNNKVDYFIRYFQNGGRSSFARWLSRSERYIPMMRTVLRKEGLPEDLVYLAMIESGFSPHAYSVASAVGPWQFMPATGKRYALRIDPWIDERRDPLKSTVAAALYLKELYAMFNDDWYLAAAGYNAGENKILRAINMYNSRDFWQLAKGEYLKRETKDYVPKLLAAAIIAKEPAKHGFADVAYLPPIEFDLVSINSRTDLEVAAQICGVPLQQMRELNPELRRASTPPDYPGYQLKLPRGCSSHFEVEYAKVPEDKRYTERVRHAQYRIRKKETLASVAKRFGTTPQTIAELNNLGKKTKLAGRLLTVPVQLASAESEPSPKAASRAEVKEVSAKAETFHKYYTVKKGDTLSSLAKRFNVTTKILAAWNNMKTRVALRPGKRIIVAKFHEKKGALVQGAG